MATGDTLQIDETGHQAFAAAPGGTFNGGTITEPLVIDASSAAAPIPAVFQVLDSNDRPMLGVSQGSALDPQLLGLPTLHADEHGATVSLDGLSQGFVVQHRTPGSGGYVTVSANGGVAINTREGSSESPLSIAAEGGSYITSIRIDGSIETGMPIHANAGIVIWTPGAPADGDISASECALWFDDTNGAAKLMVKAKSANGTVVTGSVNLA
jgi:hypothetical protein